MKFNLKKEWPFLILLVIPVIAGLILYPHMPDQIPIHWNVNGEVDNYGSRLFGTFFLPALNILLYVMFLIMPKFDPKRANYSKFEGSYNVMRYATHLLFLFLFAVTSAAALGYDVNIGKLVPAGVCILFIVFGNILGRVRHNYFVGFKFPWTLANEEVWKKTHQVGAKAMVLGGIAALIGVLATNGTLSFAIMMAGIFLPIAFVTGYSYLLFRNLEK
ncbi:MAG: putative integral rane protein [Bacillota bacterium]|jgi:uncharacterized membrane protein|nr:putative integral rane protein [Bacillota bacterium]